MRGIAMKLRLVPVLASLVFLASLSLTADDASDRTAKIAGAWQISWQARLGAEKGTVNFQQDDTQLTGSFHGQLGSPQVSGKVDGKSVSFRFEFIGKYPFTLVFKGVADGDKMRGHFDVLGVAGGYDAQGENAHPTDYSWAATRVSDPPKTAATHSQP